MGRVPFAYAPVPVRRGQPRRATCCFLRPFSGCRRSCSILRGPARAMPVACSVAGPGASVGVGRWAIRLCSSVRQQPRPNNSSKPTPLRSGKRAALKSVPPFRLHYAARLNSGVRPHERRSGDHENAEANTCCLRTQPWQAADRVRE